MEGTVGAERARLLGWALEGARISCHQMWWHYFSIGGNVSAFELEASLHHAVVLPRLQRGTLAQSADELINDLPGEMLLPRAPAPRTPPQDPGHT